VWKKRKTLGRKIIITIIKEVKNMGKKSLIIAISILSVFLISGCANMSQTEQRMVSGAAIGGTVGGPIGAGIGAGTGYLVSKLEKDD
jgi:hypothetical protein